MERSRIKLRNAPEQLLVAKSEQDERRDPVMEANALSSTRRGSSYRVLPTFKGGCTPRGNRQWKHHETSARPCRGNGG